MMMEMDTDIRKCIWSVESFYTECALQGLRMNPHVGFSLMLDFL